MEMMAIVQVVHCQAREDSRSIGTNISGTVYISTSFTQPQMVHY